MDSTIADYATLASAIIAGLAFFLSVMALIFGEIRNARQKKFMQTQHELNERLLAREIAKSQAASKADISASLIKLGKTKFRVKIWNQGNAIARNVTVDIPEGTDMLIPSDVDDKFPMEVMEKYQSVELIAAVHMGTRMKQPIKLIWDDDHEQGNSKTVHLTV